MDRSAKELDGMRFEVRVSHDAERGIYSVAGSTLPGLDAEDATLEGLAAKVEAMAPSLLAAMGIHPVVADGASAA